MCVDFKLQVDRHMDVCASCVIQMCVCHMCALCVMRMSCHTDVLSYGCVCFMDVLSYGCVCFMDVLSYGCVCFMYHMTCHMDVCALCIT